MDVSTFQEKTSTSSEMSNTTVNMKEDRIITNIVLSYIPTFGCYSIFILDCIYILYRCAKSRSFVSQLIPGAVRPHQVDHVRWVFGKSKDKTYQASLSGSQNFVARMRKSKKLRLLTCLPFFKYPTKIVYLVLFVLITTYMLTFEALNVILGIESVLKLIIRQLNAAADQMWGIRFDFLEELPGIIKPCLTISVVYTVTQSLLNIVMLTRNYRYHMLKLYQGDKEFISYRQYSSSSKLTSSVYCVSYVIVFSFWNYTIGLAIVSLLLNGVVLTCYFIVKFANIGPLLSQLATILSIILIGQMVRLGMYLLSKKYLLQRKIQEKDKELPLNVDNRKLFEIFSYFNFYLGMTGGIMSILKRFILYTVFGYLSLGRLDKSIYTKDWQRFDGGYATYVAMLQVDNAHNNPSMRLFAHFLWSNVLITRLRCSGGTSTELAHLIDSLNHGLTKSSSIKTNDHASSTPVISEAVDGKSKLTRTRWFLAYTLHKNTQLKAYRKKAMSQFNGEGMHIQIIATNPSFDQRPADPEVSTPDCKPDDPGSPLHLPIPDALQEF